MSHSLGNPPRIALLLAFAAVSFAAAAQPAASKKITFDEDAVGSAPTGFEFARTGQGAEGKWVVREDKDEPGNRLLVQESADATDYRFPLAVVKEGAYKDVALSVRARPVSGDVDQGFGVVWRYKDANNYYITRCNADENNCTIYHTVAGRRRPFQNKSIKVAKNAWHTLKLDAAGNHFVVWFDGTKVLDATDDTFKDAGRVGLWTKADSVIQFDDFSIEGR
jgi:3-keto-disaccharide hydrolase